MLGNVFQWCLDRYGDLPGGRVIDPTGPAAGSMRAIRGSGWFTPARACRAAFRRGGNPANRGEFIGFRIALSPVR